MVDHAAKIIHDQIFFRWS